MRPGTFALFAFFTCSIATAASAAEPFPPGVRAKVDDAVARDGAGRLRAILKTYDETAEHPSARDAILGKSGLKPGEYRRIRDRLGESASLPKAMWKDGGVEVAEAGHRIRVGPKEYAAGAMLVDGKEFRADPKVSLEENLRRFDAMFSSGAGLELVPSAWADDYVRIRAGGVWLYFLVTRTGEIGEQLARVGAEIAAFTRLCEQPEPPAGEKDPFMAEFGRRTLVNPSSNRIVDFRDCDDVRAYAKKPVATIAGEAVYPKLPANFCANVSRLAACMAKVAEPKVHTDGVKDWSDQADAPAPGSPAAGNRVAPGK